MLFRLIAQVAGHMVVRKSSGLPPFEPKTHKKDWRVEFVGWILFDLVLIGILIMLVYLVCQSPF